jgi:FkbM family methyltransferase
MTIDALAVVPETMAPHVRRVLGGEYDIPLKESPSTVLDIGGNIGSFAVWAAHKWPGANIVSYEPEGENAGMFRKNTEGLPVDLKQLAVLDFPGHAKLYEGLSNCGEWSIEANNHGPRSIMVECIDAATLPAADFVKIDAEGSELQILQRLKLDSVKALAVEVHSDTDLAPIREIMRNAGMRMHHLEPSVNGCHLLKYTREVVEGRLMVCVPVHQGCSCSFLQSMLHLVQHPPKGNMMLRCLEGDSLVTRARNVLTTDFLDSDCSHMLWIDSDLVFGPEHVQRIHTHTEDIVGGLYPKKQPGPAQWVVNTCDTQTEPRPDGLQQVKYVGTGFMRIARSVFDRMIERYGDQLRYNSDSTGRTEYDFWSVGAYQEGPKRRYLSEDWLFCARAGELGIPIWADTCCALGHMGWITYPTEPI